MRNDIQYHVFPSGLRLVYRRTASPVTYAGAMIGAGTRDESADESGLAHYIEHGLFKGTVHRSATQIINCIENVGGELNAYTTKEETAFYAAVPGAYTARAFDLIADMLLHPVFPEEEMTKEKQVIYDEIESYNDSPSELIYDDFEALLFQGHPLAGPVLGTKKTIRRFTAATALRFMREHYVPSRIVVFAESNRSFADILRMVQDTFAELADAAAPSGFVREAVSVSPEAQRTALYRRHTHQTHVMLGSYACSIGDEERVATALLNNILGGGAMNSRLNMQLRERYGLVYTVESVFQPMSDTGYWAVYLASEPEHADRCIGLVHEQLGLLSEEPLSRAAMHRAVAQMSGQLAIAEENRENRVLAMAKSVLCLGRAATLKETVERLRNVTPDSLAGLARRLFCDNGIFTLKYN